VNPDKHRKRGIPKPTGTDDVQVKTILALEIAFLVPAIANTFLLQLARDYSETARKGGKHITKAYLVEGRSPVQSVVRGSGFRKRRISIGG
jgi:hypothetical protein